MKQESVNHPPHYGGEDNTYEAIKVIEAWGLGFCLGNVVKYLSRAGKKGDALEDLHKARWYLDREIGALEAAEDREIGEIGDRILDYYRTEDPIDAMPPAPTAQPTRQAEFWLTCNDAARDPVCADADFDKMNHTARVVRGQGITKVFLDRDGQSATRTPIFTHVYATGLSEYDDGWYETIFTADQFNNVRETDEIQCTGKTVFSGLHPYDGRKMLFAGYYADSTSEAN